MGKTIVAYAGGLRCQARHDESGAVITTDAPKDNHGLGEAFSPSDLLAVSLGSCILSIMGLAANAIPLDMTGATATVEKTMANSPRRIVGISVNVHVPHDVAPDHLDILTAAAQACPVHHCLDPALNTKITLTSGSG